MCLRDKHLVEEDINRKTDSVPGSDKCTGGTGRVDVGGPRGVGLGQDGQARCPGRWRESDEKPEVRGDGRRLRTLPQFPHKRNEGVRPEGTVKAPSSSDVTPRDHQGSFSTGRLAEGALRRAGGPGLGGAMAAGNKGRRHGGYLRVALRREAGCGDRNNSGACDRAPALWRRGRDGANENPESPGFPHAGGGNCPDYRGDTAHAPRAASCVARKARLKERSPSSREATAHAHKRY